MRRYQTDENDRAKARGGQQSHAPVPAARGGSSPGRRTLTGGLTQAAGATRREPAGSGPIQLPDGLATSLGSGKPQIALPTHLDFAAAIVGRDLRLELPIRNTGGRDLRITAVGGDEGDLADFEVVLATPATIPSEGMIAAQVRFTPTARGKRRCRFFVQSNDPRFAVEIVELRGTGVVAEAVQTEEADTASASARPGVTPPEGLEKIQDGVPPMPALPGGERPPASRPTRALTPPQHAKLIEDTKLRMGVATAFFVIAVDRNRQALRDAAKKEAEVLAMLVEVGMGFLIPGLGRALGSGASKLQAYLGAPDDGESSTRAALVALLTRFKDNDGAKAVFTGATKGAALKVKQSAKQLYGDSDADHFLKALSQAYVEENQALRESLNEKTDEADLLALWAAYDGAFVGPGSYEAAVHQLLRRFQVQVGSIRTEEYAMGMTWNFRAVWIEVGGKRKMANVRIAEQPEAMARGTKRTSVKFQNWIDDDLAQLANNRTVREDGYIEVIQGKDVDFR